MKIEVDDQTARRILNAVENFQGQESELRRLNKKIDRLLGIEEQGVINLAGLAESVAAGRTVDESNKILIEGIIETLEHSQDSAVLALAAQLREQRDRLAAAVQENTVPA